MPIAVPFSGGIGLSIFGTQSPTGHMGLSNYLYLQSNISSGNTDLFLKNTPTLSGALKANTNWDVSLISPARLNGSNSGSFTYQQSDFSSNKYDSYYNTNKGNNAVVYTLGGDWSISDIAVEDGVMAVGTSNWTSFEKKSEKADSALYSTYISAIRWYSLPQPTVQIVTMYTYSVHWTTANPYNDVEAAGDLTLGYTDINGNPQTITASIPESYPYYLTGDIGPITSQETEPTIENWTGGPIDWPNFTAGMTTTLTVQDLVANDVELVTYPSLPPGAVIVGDKYFLTSELYPMLSNLVIPDLISVFQEQFLDPDQKLMSVNSPEFEVPDYSDIYLDIVYSSGPIEPGGGNGHLFGPIVGSTYERKIYKFGGFYRYSQFVSLLRDPATTEAKTNIDGEPEYLWYIIVKDDGTYSTVMLSDYVTWDYQYALGFPGGIYEDPYYVVGWKEISLKSITISKVISYPNCGKVDLYFYKNGKIDEATNNSNIIKSYNHNLTNGDRIKITECLSTSSSLLTNLNGIFYVSYIGPDYFGIYYDSELTSPVNIENTTAGSGKWCSIDGATWSYNSTLFSPYGKNGYGYTPSLRSVSQSVPNSDDPFERAVDVSVSDAFPDPPQYDLKGKRSWNNFYPFERFSTNDEIIYGIVNGNKFGSSLAVKKSGSDYILMVTEPGASESFELFSNYILNAGEISPENKLVVPNFLPYGRIHFYKIDSSKNITYLTSCSAGGNPWAAYETINLQERLLGIIKPYENSILNINLVNSYNSSSDNYWNGARFYSWQNDYTYNSTFDIHLPNQSAAVNEYGFVDSFGKAADFEIDGGNLYCLTSTNAKSADFLNNLRISSFDAYCKTISFSVSSPAPKSISNIIISSSGTTSNDVLTQKEELDLFGDTIKAKNGIFGIGWPTIYRDQESLYLFSRSGSNYSTKQILSSNGSKGFGSYFDIDSNLLLANKYYYSDQNGFPTTNPLQAIESYRFDINSSRYYYVNKITPTIDLSKSAYSNINSDQYELTTNLSYDNTSGNSATYILDLSRKYSLKNDTLILRDWNEYSVFQFNYGLNQFVPKTHKFATLNTDDSFIKLSKGLGSTFFDASGEWDTGQSSQPLLIIEGSRSLNDGLINYLVTSDTHYLNGVNLYLKTIEGYSSGNATLFQGGLARATGNSTLYMQPPMPISTGVNLFAKQIDVANTGVNLFHKSTSLSSGTTDLFIRNSIVTGGIPLFFNTGYTVKFPLTILNTVKTDFKDSNATLFTRSFITSTPNFSGGYDLFMKALQKDGYAASYDLYMCNNFTLADSGITLYTNPSSGNTGTAFSNSSLYINSSGNRVYDFSTSMKLLIKCPETAQMPLIVYNTMATGSLSMYASGANYISSGANLYVSGVDYPNKSINMRIRGTV